VRKEGENGVGESLCFCFVWIAREDERFDPHVAVAQDFLRNLFGSTDQCRATP
jgi:hypothetical protein